MNEALNLPSIIIGWFFGIASPLVIDKIKQYSKRRSLVNGILSELEEIQFKLSCVTYTLGKRYGRFDRQFAEWLQSIFSDYKGIDDHKDSPNSLIGECLKLSDEHLQTLIIAEREKLKGVGLNLKTYRLTFINAKISEITLLDIESQMLIFDINARIEMINEEIEASKSII